MSGKDLGLVAIGNAIVDVLAHTDDALIEQEELVKGSMNLIDTERAEYLYGKMPPGVEVSGGSAANTVAGYASMGGKAGYIGKTADDQLGNVFRHDIKAAGIEYDTPPLVDGEPTARCLIMVTPDAQRTMNTFLGASVEFSPEDVNIGMIRRAEVLYLEGYLFDKEKAKEAFWRAAESAKHEGIKVALTLSDTFCVERHRDDFMNLVEQHIDILFANEDEIKALFQTDTFDEAADKVQNMCETIALTRSEKGSVVIQNGKRYTVDAEPIDKLVDTTGAGDLYAAGFLYGYTEGLSPEECGRYGSIAAAEVISHMGPRPECALSDLIKKKAA